jgi:hypothetical protein
MKLENLKMLFVEMTLGQEIKIGHVFFVFPAPNPIALLARTGL